MATGNLYNHSPYRPKQSDAEIMLLALGVGILLCLSGVVGVTVSKRFTPVEESFWNGDGCDFGPYDVYSNKDLANTIEASYLLTSPEIDYVPIEEIPLGINYEGPNVKFNNQKPDYITQEGIIGGDVVKYENAVVERIPEFSLLQDPVEPVDVVVPEREEVFYPDIVCERPFYSRIAPASPTDGEDAFRAYVMSMINLDYSLNRGEEYLFNINFTIGIDGTLSNIVIQSEQGYLPPRVKKDIIKVFNTMPKWQPASQNGRLVPTTFILPIKVNVQ